MISSRIYPEQWYLCITKFKFDEQPRHHLQGVN